MPGVRIKPATPPMLGPGDFHLWTGLPVPDPITFVVSSLWLNRRLYPRQATLIKIIFLRLDLFTPYDFAVVREWESNFIATRNNGITPGVIDRMIYLKANGHKWFREVLLVIGRRGGKGYVSALAMSYILWHYMSLGDPQAHYGIDRDKRLTCLIYAGRKEQARDNLWRDLVTMINGAPCFKPYLGKPMGESLSVYAPADKRKMARLAKRGIVSGLDMATFKIEPLPATPMSGRGGASFMIGLDEEAHMVASGANRSADEIFGASTPALDQFKKDAFIIEPSSPWEMIGQFYKNWENALALDDAGDPLYPNILMVQLTSWDIYEDWEQAHELDLFPSDFEGDLAEYIDDEPPRLAQLKLAIQSYDDEMRRLERSDPDKFSVERMSHWQTSLDAYLDPKMIAAMFNHNLHMVTSGALGTRFVAHADPSAVNDNFGFAVGHTEKDPETGYDICVFDLLTHWDPADWENHTIDYTKIVETLWDYVKGYPLDELMFDQWNSKYLIDELTGRTRSIHLPKRVTIGLRNSTAPRNLAVAENFKAALNQGWIKAPFYDEASLELQFLQMKNGKVIHQSAGPVQHDDVARCMMEVTWSLLEGQVQSWLHGPNGIAPIGMALSGGIRPWMSPQNENDSNILNQFQQIGRGYKQGQTPSPTRGGRDLIPRRTPGYRG